MAIKPERYIRTGWLGTIVSAWLFHPIIMTIIMAIIVILALIFIEYIMATVFIILLFAMLIFAIVGIRKTKAPIPTHWKAFLIIGFILIALFAMLNVPKMFEISAGREPSFCQYGDIDHDGYVSTTDSQLAANYNPSWSWDRKERADVNNDGVVNNADAGLIFQYSQYMIDHFPVEYDQDDGIPEVYKIDAPQSAYVDEGFTVTVWGNDSNGECLDFELYYKKPDGTMSDVIDIGSAPPNMPVIHTLRLRDTGTYRVFFRAWDDAWGYVDPTPSPLVFRDIEVFTEQQPPFCRFSWEQSGLTVSFNDESQDFDGYITSWSWNFGDGSTSSNQNPIHTYSSYGTYMVTLTVTDNDGLSTSHSERVNLGTQYTLTTYVYPSDGGTVTPNGGSYQDGATVTLTATPSAGYTFSHWSGDITGSQNPATITMDSDKTVIANFIEVSNQYTLTVSTSPIDGGDVTLTPAGGAYNAGEIVTLTAKPKDGYKFDKWISTDFISSDNPYQFTMPSHNVEVTAHFVKEGINPLYIIIGIIAVAVFGGLIIYWRRKR